MCHAEAEGGSTRRGGAGEDRIQRRGRLDQEKREEGVKHAFEGKSCRMGQ